MKFSVEWLDAPGVRDQVLAATWARLEITANGEVVSDLVASDSRRSGLYGPILPVVEWIVENWWSLLHEPSPTSPLVAGRRAFDWMRPWVQRHNLLFAREGMALPDATFVRDGDEILVMWTPDPFVGGNGRVRFVGNGQVRVSASDFSAAAAGLVEGTLARLGDKVEDSEEARSLRDAWAAIQSADAVEGFVCRSIALLGGDPYDPADASSTLLDRLTSLRNSLSPDLLNDLLEGSGMSSLGGAASWLEEQSDYFGNGVSTAPSPLVADIHAGPSAHAFGYAVAREVRRALHISPRDPIADLGRVLVDGLGWDADVTRAAHDPSSLDGLVGFARVSRKPILLGRDLALQSTRFFVARAAFFVATGTLGEGRLLTRAVTRPQRAGRAFAAEFLAPSAALAKRVRGRIGEADVVGLSEEFNVSPRLIEHQIENHGIGFVAP